jgi:hypothetical protein
MDTNGLSDKEILDIVKPLVSKVGQAALLQWQHRPNAFIKSIFSLNHLLLL